MKIILRAALPILTLLIVASSCKKTTTPIADQTKIITLPTGGSTVITANNQLAFNLLQTTLQQDATTSNKLISPLSIYLALAMTYNGSAGATMDSMAKTLQIPGLDINTLNAACKALITQLPGEDNEVQLSIANSIWYRQNVAQPLAPFLATTKNDYNAAVQSLDFNNSNSVTTINNWVAQQTKNKIPTVIQSIDPLAVMYLINAIYFNGGWQNAFKTSETRNDTFHLPNGNTKIIPFMNQEVTLNTYADNDNNFRIVELPYGGGNSYSMYLLLPTDLNQSIPSLATQVEQTGLAATIGKMGKAKLALEMPKWEYSYGIDNMKPELSQLGMGIAFTDDADFSNLYDPAQLLVKISKVIHKTYIKVDEAGTQATGVTVVVVEPTLSNPNISPIRFNHPFLYSIVEKQTGAVLFLGVVNDPSAN